jgi:putative oxidoreductase
MKKLFQRLLSTGNVDFALLIVRVSFALMMLTHGLPKLEKLIAGETVAFVNVMGLGRTLSLTLAVFAEVVCSVFLLFGLWTRFAAFFMACTMAVAAFYIHGGDPFSQREMSLLYLVVYVMLLLVGGGKYSIDARLYKIYKGRRTF